MAPGRPGLASAWPLWARSARTGVCVALMGAFGHGLAVVGSQGRQPLDEENHTKRASPGRGDRTD